MPGPNGFARSRGSARWPFACRWAPAAPASCVKFSLKPRSSASPAAPVGLVLATWGVDVLLALAPEGLPRASAVRADVMTLVFTGSVSVLTTMLFGLAPALHATSPRPQQPVQADSVRASESRAQRRMQKALVVSELTLAQVLLAGAGLLIVSSSRCSTCNLDSPPNASWP